jgi:YbbR domain-containing protein
VDKRKESQLGIKIICVVASFVLWMYIHGVENPIQTDRFSSVPVTLINTEVLAEQGLIISPDQEFKVDLNIKGPFMELKKIKTDKIRLTADISGYALKKGEFKVKVDVNEKPAGDYTILDADLHVSVKLDELVKRSVPVKTDLNIKAKSGFVVQIPENKVTEVKVSGPSEFVKDISYVKADVASKEVEKDIPLSLKLVAYNSEDKPISEDIVKIEPNTIDMLVAVKKAKTVDVALKQKGAPGNKDILIREMEIAPNKIEIAGDTELLNSISTIETEVIDLTDVTGSRTQEVKLILPAGVTMVNGKAVATLKITADKIIQKSYSIDIGINNLGEDYTINNDKLKASIVVSGTDTRISALNMTDIKASIDLTNVKEGESTVPINIKVPEGVTVISTNPQSVKVNLTRKSGVVSPGTVQVTPTPIPTSTTIPTPATPIQ